MNIDGKVWFFLSAAQIAEAFPYLSEKVVRGILDKLVADGYLVKDHKGAGQERFNRTNWYALTNSSLVFFHLPIWENGTAQAGKSIVNNSSYNTPSNEGCNNTIIPPTPKKFDFRKALLGLGVSQEVADAWMQVRKAKKAVNTEIAFNAIAKEIAKTGKPADACIRLAVEKSWCGFKADWMENAENPSRTAPGMARPARGRGTAAAMENMLEMGKRIFGSPVPAYDEQ